MKLILRIVYSVKTRVFPAQLSTDLPNSTVPTCMTRRIFFALNSQVPSVRHHQIPPSTLGNCSQSLHFVGELGQRQPVDWLNEQKVLARLSFWERWVYRAWWALWAVLNLAIRTTYEQIRPTENYVRGVRRAAIVLARRTVRGGILRSWFASLARQLRRVELARLDPIGAVWLRETSKKRFEASARKQNRFDDDVHEYEMAFRRLKILTGQMQDRTNEQRFFTLEIKNKMLKLETGFLERTAGGWYGRFSGFGNSLIYPVVWVLLFALCLTMATAYLSMGAEGKVGGLCMPFSENCQAPPLPDIKIGEGLIFFIRSVFPLFMFSQLKLFGSEGDSLTLLAPLVGSTENPVDPGSAEHVTFVVVLMLHSVFNVIFWFLFALALRRKFQID